MEMLSFSCTLLSCISEPCPLSRLPRKTRICYRGCDIRRKRRHEGTSDIQTCHFAILKKNALHANMSHWNVPRCRRGDCLEGRLYHEERQQERSGGSSTPWTWERLEGRWLGWASNPGFCLEGPL